MNEEVKPPPTWGDFGNLYTHLAESCDEGVWVIQMRPEVAKAMASAEALKAITGTLTDEQQAIVSRTMAAELAKQGY